MKVVVSESYESLAPWVRRLPLRQPHPDEILRDERNLLYRTEVEGHRLVVKRYKVPNAFNRVVYSFLRPSKARRAYDHSLRLRALGFEAAEPVAYVECRRCGLFHTGYYVAAWLPDRRLDELRDVPLERKRDVLEAFAAFTVRMHEAGVLDLDYNPSNIFFRPENGGYRFSLVDVNRVRFKRSLSRRECAEVMRTFNMDEASLGTVLLRYAALRGWDWRIFGGTVLLKQGINLRVRLREALKRLLGLGRR